MACPNPDWHKRWGLGMDVVLKMIAVCAQLPGALLTVRDHSILHYAVHMQK
jgi:hypothetical protein